MRRRLIGASLVATVAVVQLLWAVSVPPFRALDEVDHVIRAASVANGEWSSDFLEPPGDRRGMAVRAPGNIVDATRAQCAALTYRSPSDCTPVGDLGGGDVFATTSAYAQSPVFYGVVGTAAKGQDGARAGFVMRLTALTMVLLMLAGAVILSVRRARTLWPVASLCALLTPIFMYSSIIPAANALEMSAGIALWTALLVGSNDEFDRPRLLVAAVASLCLVSLRQLGPVLLLLIVAHAIAITGPKPLLAGIKRHKVLSGVATAGVVAAGCLHLVWIRAVGYPGLATDYGGYTWPRPVTDTIQWTFQSFATGQSRVNPAPLAAYALAIPPTVVLVVLALLMTRKRRFRWGLAASVATGLCAPILFAWLTFPAHGAFWQGRYGIAFTAGWVLVAGVALDEVGKSRLAKAVAISSAVAMVSANAVVLAWFVDLERARPASMADDSWLMPSTPVIVVAMALALGVLVSGLVAAGRIRRGSSVTA